MSVSVIPEDFTAWVDLMPGAGNKLIVKGEVQVPTSGWAVSLVEASPQGINPAILILDLSASPPHGNVLQVITKEPVRFEKPNGSAYTSVTIRYSGDEFTIPVGQTH